MAAAIRQENECAPELIFPMTLHPTSLFGDIRQEDAPAPFGDGTWYSASAVGDGIFYVFPVGALASACYLTADMLLDGNRLTTFIVHLQEGENGPKFSLSFGVLNQCQARIRIPLDAVHQNRWGYEREGAWLKPTSGGAIVDLRKVDRMMFTVFRKASDPCRWFLTHFAATSKKPLRLVDPILPKGSLLDELGQSTLHDWATRSRDREEVNARLKRQLEESSHASWPDEFSRWGGWKNRSFEATGFFRTHHDGTRWWLVDPDGCVFWSTGLDCVRFGVDASYQGLENALTWLPDKIGDYAQVHGRHDGRPSVNYLPTHFIRAFGPEEDYAAWTRITLSLLRKWRFNTVANWSDWEMARAAGFPYVRPMHPRFRAPMIFRDFPDVFDPQFEKDCAAFGEQLRETKDDPAFIGYFLMNEPTWGFAVQTPAEGMWWNTPACATREAFAAFLSERHSEEPTERDFVEFSSIMVEKLFGGLSDACRRVDSNHLNLGGRYYTSPPEWAMKAMKQFDVFSLNCYQERVWPDRVEKITRELHMPVLVGEWHFGALDAGLPASGIGHVRDQAARGQIYRHYLENAAALPGCVGVHYFTLYDQSALGRYDGENYNIGFLDVCNRPYELLTEAARISHERMYEVAAGKQAPCDRSPEHLPLLFM